MITNTETTVLPAGMGNVARAAVVPAGAATGKEVRGTGPSANVDTAVLASVKQSSVAAESQTDPKQEALSEEGMQEVADALSRTFGEKQSLEFSVDQDTGVSVIKVTQAGSGEVVRQIPNEEALQMMQKLDQQRDTGNDTAVLFDQMA